jgi:hypothetical protein
VSSGKSLIDSAKVQGGMRELQQLKVIIYSFYEVKDRFPGDFNDTFNKYENNVNKPKEENYPINTFSSEYANFQVSVVVAPWVDLYLSGFHTFKPSLETSILTYSGSSFRLVKDKSCPVFKYLKNSMYCNNSNVISFYFIRNYVGSNPTINTWQGTSGYYGSIGSSINFNEMSPIFLEKIDRKMDDGLYNKGDIRTSCAGTGGCDNDICSYQKAVETKSKCNRMIWKVMK